MNTEVKALLITALRSGKYKQAEGLLRDGDKYCCLGVTCDIAPKELGRWDNGTGIDRYWVGSESYNPERTNLTPELMEWSGISATECNVLQELNDEGWTFHAIARWIEENL